MENIIAFDAYDVAEGVLESKLAENLDTFRQAQQRGYDFTGLEFAVPLYLYAHKGGYGYICEAHDFPEGDGLQTIDNLAMDVKKSLSNLTDAYERAYPGVRLRPFLYTIEVAIGLSTEQRKDLAEMLSAQGIVQEEYLGLFTGHERGLTCEEREEFVKISTKDLSL